MKVIKRDGRMVDYNREKIEIAIEKANNEVMQNERVTKQEIKEITKYVEGLDRKRILVEDIQDIIEEQLMAKKKFKLAKKYMLYRYTRALVRRSNTTDETILGIIKNQNMTGEEEKSREAMLAPTQRDYIAGEVSKDLTKRILLPEKITKAHEDGVLHFHDMGYFIQPIFNCSSINIGDMLDNGIVINGTLIESPKSFQVACDITSRIIITVASGQYGGQSVDISHLGKYVRKSYDKFKKELAESFTEEIEPEVIEKIAKQRLQKEIAAGVQTLQYQINTLITTNGRTPNVSLFLYLKENDKYIAENAMIVEEIIRQKTEGVKNKDGNYIAVKFPRLIYVLDENNSLNGGKYDYITKLSIECSQKCENIGYISAKKMKQNYQGNVFSPMDGLNFLSPWKDENGNYKFEGRFNQGIVSINLPQIAIITDGNEEKFWNLLNERLEICKEALMCRHYSLLGTLSNISPIHWQYGAISRIESGEKIDQYLKNGYSTLSLGYIGIYETTKLMKGVSQISKEGYDFAIKIMKRLKETVERWKKETNLSFTLFGTQSKILAKRFAFIDKEKYGQIKDITSKDYYMNSFYIPEDEELDEIARLKIESEFQNLSLGGAISKVNLSKVQMSIEDLVKFIYENIQYVEIYK